MAVFSMEVHLLQTPCDRGTDLPVDMADFDLFSTKVGQQKWVVQMISRFAYI